MKKFLAVLLSVLLLALTPVCAFAATGEAPAQKNRVSTYASSLIANLGDAAGRKSFVENAKAAASVLFSRLFAAFDEAGAVPTMSAKALRAALRPSVSGDDDSAVPEDAMSLLALSDLMSRYVFVRLADPEGLADLIADGVVYDYRVLDDGKGTVVVRVNLHDHPELLNAEVFQALIGKLFDRQKEEMLKNNDDSVDYLMSYEHIAGELALHTLVWAASDELLRLTGSSNETLLDLYRSAVVADLDYGESRLPADVIVFIGKLVILTLRFNLVKLFG